MTDTELWPTLIYLRHDSCPVWCIYFPVLSKHHSATHLSDGDSSTRTQQDSSSLERSELSHIGCVRIILVDGNQWHASIHASCGNTSWHTTCDSASTKLDMSRILSSIATGAERIAVLVSGSGGRTGRCLGCQAVERTGEGDDEWFMADSLVGSTTCL